MYSNFDTTVQEYVEIIYEIQESMKVARVKDIAERRGVNRSSVSTALAALKRKDLINHETYGLVELTAKGIKLAEELETRQKIIKDFFVNILSIDPDIAEENACKLEHHISSKVIESFKNFMLFLKKQPELLVTYKNELSN